MNNFSAFNQDAIQALLILLLLTPFVVVLALANLSLRLPGLRWLVYGAVAVFSGGFLLIGMVSLLLAWMASTMNQAPGLGVGVAPNWYLLGLWSLITGAGALLALTPPARSAARRLLPSFDADNPVHIVSLSFALFLVGLTAMQLVILGDLKQLTDLGVQVGLAQVWAQGVGLTMVGLAGIGLWTRRSWREVAARLGITRLTGRTLLVSAACVVLFMALDLGWTLAWQRLDPEGLEAVTRVSGALFAGLINLPGALSIGITAAISEEIIYRGALQPRFGLVLTAALFAVSHVQYGISPAVVEVFVIGLALGLIRRRYGLTTCMVIHFGYNTLNLLLLPPR